MKPCPFCSKEIDIDDGDTLYPNGRAWEDKAYGRSYYPCKGMPKEQWCWSLHCSTISGGCGCEMSADTKEEAIEKWNRRV
jgi:hypothetical protein